MALKTNYKFLFVGGDKNIFVEDYSYGQLFITISAKAIGKKIWSTMCRYFSANPNEESYKRFKDSLKEVNKVLDKLDTKDLSALIGFIAGKDLYLAQMGDATTYLARNNSIEIISQGLSGKGGDTFTNIAKGEIMAGDFVVLSSVSLFQYISRVDLAKVLDANALNDSLSKLNKLISTKISGKAGIVGMTFEKAPKLIKEAVVVTKKPPRKLLAKISNIKIPKIKIPKIKIPKIDVKTPKFLSNAVDYIKKLLAKILKIKIPKIKIPKIKIPKIEVKTPRFLSNAVDSIKNFLLSARHRIGMTFKKIPELIKEAVAVTKKLPHKLLGIFAIAIPIFVLGIILYAVNSALVHEQIFTAVIIERDDKEVVETILDEADNVRQVENPKVFVDFSIKQPNMNPLGLLALKDRFFVFEHNKLYEIGLDKIEELATFEGSEAVVSATDFENQNSLVFMTKSGELIQYKNGSVSFVETTDGEFHKGIAIDDWEDRIYILDSSENWVWHYSYLSSSDVFGSAKGYGIDNSLEDVIDFTVDGLIYILHKDASIDQLYKGLKQDFFIRNEPLTEFDVPSKIYTEDGLSQIFVMDSGTSRIFMYTKDLKTGDVIYSGQIVFPTISDLRDLCVDKNASKLYLLDAQKVYEVQL